ncbi:uncharacterized protein AMSG_00854 [Thecamonas trahens ATCC 50062]|uniref:Uncharacterized protein n=1 Tax=Thecamonas trahens ATCC 50062 TaxID=461836 RepID=A0A0L0DEX9_THETB|nr:hypothetical protein AMSG_00854 [Thecamonas trahens ATCC 50062]KNC50696.1 hypothetical protein AMSG_00854 [Thecamonas trahens ATCC 50062]|eukprot:XP_013762573.1 hypothetical protein AMSG_00854 [Thecamonas trahens ATCC 50062]
MLAPRSATSTAGPLDEPVYALVEDAFTYQDGLPVASAISEMEPSPTSSLGVVDPAASSLATPRLVRPTEMTYVRIPHAKSVLVGPVESAFVRVARTDAAVRASFARQGRHLASPPLPPSHSPTVTLSRHKTTAAPPRHQALQPPAASVYIFPDSPQVTLYLRRSGSAMFEQVVPSQPLGLSLGDEFTASLGTRTVFKVVAHRLAPRPQFALQSRGRGTRALKWSSSTLSRYEASTAAVSDAKWVTEATGASPLILESDDILASSSDEDAPSRNDATTGSPPIAVSLKRPRSPQPPVARRVRRRTRRIVLPRPTLVPRGRDPPPSASSGSSSSQGSPAVV